MPPLTVRKPRALAEQADVVLVVGSKNSSNSNRLAELAQRMGKAAYLIDDASDIREAWVRMRPASA